MNDVRSDMFPVNRQRQLLLCSMGVQRSSLTFLLRAWTCLTGTTELRKLTAVNKNTTEKEGKDGAPVQTRIYNICLDKVDDS